MALPEDTIIRHATREDVRLILELIHELAAYEKESSAVQATEQTLLDTLTFAESTLPTPSPPLPTTPTRPATTLLLFDAAGICAGMALYFYNYSTWRSAPGIYLEDLYVRQSERGKGYGKALLQALARETVKVGGKRLEWAVLKWNEPSLRFYEGIGAQRMEEWVGMRVDGEALGRLAGEDVTEKP